MSEKDRKYYMVREDMLPESLLKTAMAKEMLARGEAKDITDAVNKFGIARSTYYKYKDGIIPFFNADNFEIINISLLLTNILGVLSGVINCVASCNANILTINQNLPLHGVAYVTISINVEEMTVTVDGLIKKLRELRGVRNVEIIGKS